MDSKENKIAEGLSDLKLEADSVQDKLEKKLNKNQLEFIIKIAHKVQAGMDVEESCVLAGVDYKKFKEALLKDKDLARLIELKRLSYKWTLLRALNKKAIEKGDDKMALLLLQTAFPDEFGKKKKDKDGGVDPVKDAIDYISKNGDSSALIDPRNGRGGEPKDKKDRPVVKSILDIFK